jgi:hypothetical protein
MKYVVSHCLGGLLFVGFVACVPQSVTPPAGEDPEETAETCAAGFERVSPGDACTDINECLTNNGGCGDALLATCSNNSGAQPTCTPLPRCATNNGSSSIGPVTVLGAA